MCKVSICATEYERALSDTICAVICASYVLISLVALISLCNNCGNSPLLSNRWPWKQKHFINYSHLHFFLPLLSVLQEIISFLSFWLGALSLAFGFFLLSECQYFSIVFSGAESIPLSRKVTIPCVFELCELCACVFLCVCLLERRRERQRTPMHVKNRKNCVVWDVFTNQFVQWL